jgi:hypothetical protein
MLASVPVFRHVLKWIPTPQFLNLDLLSLIKYLERLIKIFHPETVRIISPSSVHLFNFTRTHGIVKFEVILTVHRR